MQMWWIFVCSRTNATEHFSPTEFGAGAFCYSNSSREFTHLNNYRMWFDTDVTDFAYVTSARANRGNGNLLFACHRFTAPTVLIWFEITHFKQKNRCSSYPCEYDSVCSQDIAFLFVFYANNFNMIDSMTQNVQPISKYETSTQDWYRLTWQRFFSCVILIAECF